MATILSKHNKVVPFVVATVSAIVILYWGAKYPSWRTFDDAFITYRYADNLRQGMGLLYNPGEWVLGTTTPLYALLLAALGLFIADLQLLGHWLAVLSWIAASWAAIALLRQEGWPRAGLAAGLLLSFQPYFFRSLGMESTLLVALMLWLAWAWLGGRKVLAVFLAAALILTRQDSALWLIVLGVEVWRRQQRLPWREAVAVAALSLPWFLYAFWRYGSPLPNSAAAKVGQNDLMPVGYQDPFWQGLWRAATIDLGPAVTVLFAALLVFGLLLIAWRARQLWWLVGWTGLYVIAYLWLGVVSFHWYFVPPLATLSLVVAVAIGFLLGDDRLAAPNDETRPAAASGRPIWLGPTLAVLGILSLAFIAINQGNRLRSLLAQPEQPVAYISAGQWLAENTAEDAAVATIEIGLVGYHSQRPIVDTMGLVSRDMTDHQVGWVETLVYALNSYQPEYALTLPNTGWDAVVERWWFKETYQEVARFGKVTIYERQEPEHEPVQAVADVEFVGGLSLQGASFASQELAPGQNLVTWLDLAVHEAQPPELALQIRLVDAQNFAPVAEAMTRPFDGGYASDRWQPGDELHIPTRLSVPGDLQPGVYRLGVSIVDPARDGGLPLAAAPDVLNPDVHIGWLRSGAPETPGAISNPWTEQLDLHWQDGIRLAGLAIPTVSLAKGETLPVRLEWQTTRPVERDLTVFLHLVDETGQIVAQKDQRPFAGRWPTPAWQPGQAYIDLQEIVLPAGLPPGNYYIRLGLYDDAGRLPLADGVGDYWAWNQPISIE